MNSEKSTGSSFHFSRFTSHFLVLLHPNAVMMLQKTFGIYNDNLDDCRLFVEAGNRHIAFWCKDDKGIAKAFEFFQFDADDDGMGNVLQEVKMQSKLMGLPITIENLVWDNEEAICIPVKFYKEGLAADYLAMMLGESDRQGVQAQPLDRYVILSRQAGYADLFKKTFAAKSFSHKFFKLLQKYTGHTGYENDNRVYAVFYPAHFILTVVKDNALQMIRSIDYSTSEDALYSIIHICNEHDMHLNTTDITASGLIDTTSNLYNTLYSYLEKFALQKSNPAVFDADGFAEYPAHYFLPFIQE